MLGKRRCWLGIAAVLAACSSEPGSQGEPDSGGQPPAIERDRSLVWTDPAIVDDPDVIGLARVMAAVASDGHGGQLVADWFETFATTAHSERLGPALLIEELRGSLGTDPTAWDLDQLPFIVTAVHNRIDLGPRGGGCGELRVSLASVHPIYAPFHLIFLFRQPDDGAGCRETARRWAQLSSVDHDAFVGEATAILDDTIRNDRFLLAESVELTVSPWEWRQWDGLANPPLFQTVDTERLNQPGPLRDDFVAWAEANADGLMARTVDIPDRFRGQSVQAPPGIPREPLDLAIDGYPGLAAEIEIVGCVGCHTDDAEFVQTTPQRTFSPFYDKELDARAAWLAELIAGDAATPPFGPLQAR